jgi:ferredoxin
MEIHINESRCTGCGDCVAECPIHAVTIHENIARIDLKTCIRCTSCVAVCKERAIFLQGKRAESLGAMN